MGAESLEDPVGDPALETPERLLGRLAFLLLLQVVGATWWMTRDLGESGEVGFGAVPRDVADLGEQLRRGQFGHARNGGETGVEGRGQLPDLLRDLLELSRQLSEPDHPLTCDSSPDLPVAGEQASGPIQVSLRCQPVG